jgi:hypothetical protein
VCVTGKLLSAFLSGLSDRNVTVKKSYAIAIGHLCKVRLGCILFDCFVARTVAVNCQNTQQQPLSISVLCFMYGCRWPKTQAWRS